MTALSPRPANSQVSRARPIGLQRTRPNGSATSTGRIRIAVRRPLSVKGMSVFPVCRPLRLHAVSPCLIAKTFISVPPAGLDVVGLGRANGRGKRLLPPSPARDLRHIVPIPGDEGPMVDEL